jgi:polyisoprenoid-binding protein YceI
MKTSILALFLCATFSFSAGAATSYRVDPKHTFPSFEISHLGFSIQRGRFDQTSGKVQLDPETGKGHIDITIEAASISTGLDELEKHLQGEDFLDASRYPKITFVSDKLLFSKDQLVAADGVMTLHGVSKPVHLTIDHFYCGMNLIAMKNTCGANATTTIKRSEFGVDKYVPKVGDEVRVAIQIEATKD